MWPYPTMFTGLKSINIITTHQRMVIHCIKQTEHCLKIRPVLMIIAMYFGHCILSDVVANNHNKFWWAMTVNSISMTSWILQPMASRNCGSRWGAKCNVYDLDLAIKWSIVKPLTAVLCLWGPISFIRLLYWVLRQDDSHVIYIPLALRVCRLRHLYLKV